MELNHSVSLASHITCQRVLKLNDQSLTDEDLKNIIKILPRYPFLKGLDLSGNKISDEGVLSLMEALEQHCPNIKELNLVYNQLTDKSFACLDQNKTLHRIFVFANALDLNADYALTVKSGQIKKNYTASLNFFARESSALFKLNQDKRFKLSRLDASVILMIMPYLADIQESPFHKALITLSIMGQTSHSGYKNQRFELHTAYEQLTESHLEKSICLTQGFHSANKPATKPDCGKLYRLFCNKPQKTTALASLSAMMKNVCQQIQNLTSPTKEY